MYFPFSKPKLHTYIRGQWRIWWDSVLEAKGQQARYFSSLPFFYPPNASTFFRYMLLENTSLKKTVTQTGIGRHPAAKPVASLQFYKI